MCDHLTGSQVFITVLFYNNRAIYWACAGKYYSIELVWSRVSFRKLSKGGGATGGILILSGDLMAKVSQTPSGGSGVCLNMCVCRVSYRILSFVKGGTPKLGVDVERMYN